MGSNVHSRSLAARQRKGSKSGRKEIVRRLLCGHSGELGRWLSKDGYGRNQEEVDCKQILDVGLIGIAQSLGWGGSGMAAEGTSSIVSIFFFPCSLFYFIGVQLLYNVLLVSAVQQSESVVRVYISTLFQISFPFRSPQSLSLNPFWGPLSVLPRGKYSV